MGRGVAPLRVLKSVGLTADTATLTRTSPGPGSGRSTSSTRSTSAAGPWESYSAAFTSPPRISGSYGRILSPPAPVRAGQSRRAAIRQRPAGRPVHGRGRERRLLSLREHQRVPAGTYAHFELAQRRTRSSLPRIWEHPESLAAASRETSPDPQPRAGRRMRANAAAALGHP